MNSEHLAEMHSSCMHVDTDDVYCTAVCRLAYCQKTEETCINNIECKYTKVFLYARKLCYSVLTTPSSPMAS